MRRLRGFGAPLAILAASGCVAWAAWPTASPEATPAPLPRVTSTSRAALDEAAALARARLEADDRDVAAAIRLGEVLLRQARVETDASLAIEAERVLDAALRHEPGEYSALRILGAAYLSQHRFADAVEIATRAIAVREDDAWSHGVLGDASMELGEYDRAFEAFDTMVRLRPDAASYARVAYAHEVQGRLREALRHMRMAAEATSAHDPEALAWHHAQIGSLLLQLGEVDEAARAFARADHVFPDHPYARNGLARVAAARGDDLRALEMYRSLMAASPTPELAASIGDLLERTGDAAGAEAMYVRAEALERDGWEMEEPQPAALARLLAERGRHPGEAVRLAEDAARRRGDIFTMDALAWAYFQAGRLSDARAASVEARRTGTADRRILCHAAAIEEALAGKGASGAPVDRAQCRFER